MSSSCIIHLWGAHLAQDCQACCTACIADCCLHHVLSLHVCWQAAGEVVAAHFTEGSSAAATLGVFVGIQQMEYGSLAAPFLAKMGPFTATGGPFSVAAGRISFTFGFKGPAVRLLLYFCTCMHCSFGTAA